MNKLPYHTIIYIINHYRDLLCQIARNCGKITDINNRDSQKYFIKLFLLVNNLINKNKILK